MIQGAFAEILKSNRSGLNARFAETRRLHSGLDGEAFSAILRDLVAPAAAAVEALKPDCAERTTLALYDLSLDLLGKNLLGPGSRYPWIAAGWRDLLPSIPRQLAQEPARITGSITNALYNLSQASEARPQQWIDIMRSLSALVPDPDSFLQAGQVAAWRSGLAHFRQGALEICHSLSPAVLKAALCMPPASSLDSGMVERMQADPWLDPGVAAGKSSSGERTLQLVRRVGSFRGFGGPFLLPPKVFSAGQHFLVLDGETHWLLVADVFGSTLHRADGLTPISGTASFNLDKLGNVQQGKLKQRFDELAGFSSAAGTDSTLAVTSPLSFAISLVAAVPS